MKRICIFLVVSMSVGQVFGGIKEKLGLGLNINAHKLYGDTRSGNFGVSGGNLLLQYRWKPALFIESELGFLTLSTKMNGTTLDTDMINIGAKAGYTLVRSSFYQPFMYFGVGALGFSENGKGPFWDGYVAFGAGAEFFASEFLAVNVTADFRYTSGDGFDGGLDGWRTDGYLNLGLGLIYHFERRSQQGSGLSITDNSFQPEPLYTEVSETNEEEERDHTDESTDQELNFNPFQSLMQKEKSAALEDGLVTMEVEGEPEPDRTMHTIIYTVRPDDWLSKIAQTFYGDPMEYTKISEANLDVIQNPNAVYPGQKLKISILKGSPILYTVKQGESLSRIAIKFYGDPMKFKDILRTNQDLIKNPDLIYAGQILEIWFPED